MKEYSYYSTCEINRIRDARRRENYRARTIAVRKQKVYIFVFSVIFFAVLFFASGIKAETNVSETRVKLFRSIMIYSGDTLESIAEENISPEYSSYNKLIDEIKFINDLNTDNITVGNRIIIPYYTDVQWYIVIWSL